MTEQEIDQLEELLGKLQGYVKHPIAIACGVQDSWNIGAYHYDGGKLKAQAESYTLNEGVKMLMKELQP
jgi:hypothetical protein